MRDEYDFSTARPNPYATQLKKSVTIRLDEDSIAYFKTAANQGALQARRPAASARPLVRAAKPVRVRKPVAAQQSAAHQGVARGFALDLSYGGADPVDNDFTDY